MNELRTNQQRAKHAITFIWIILGLQVVATIAVYFQHQLLETYAHGGKVAMANAEAVYYVEGLLSDLFLFTYIISAVLFIQWFRRAYFNLHQKTDSLAHSEGWAAGCWFVPVVNFYRPYQIMKELYQETQELLMKKEININRKLKTSIVNLWWALCLISVTVALFVELYFHEAKSTHALLKGTVANLISGVLVIMVALITIKVIKDYATVEPLLREVKEEA